MSRADLDAQRALSEALDAMDLLVKITGARPDSRAALETIRVGLAAPAPVQGEPVANDVEDAARLDWLELMGNEPEGILLHDGGDFTGCRGLGLRRIGRTLRAAIDAARKAAT